MSIAFDSFYLRAKETTICCLEFTYLRASIVRSPFISTTTINTMRFCDVDLAAYINNDSCLSNNSTK